MNIKSNLHIGFLSLVWFGYAFHILFSEEPFFVETEFFKHKATEWLYDLIGSVGTSIVFLVLGVIFGYWFIKNFREEK